MIILTTNHNHLTKEIFMTNFLSTELDAAETAFGNLIAKLKSSTVVQTAETDAEAIGSATLAYIKQNALTDLYQIAIAALTGAATGTPWATIGATVVSQGETAGITIAKGAESIVIALAQADLIAQGKLVAPTSGAVVTAAPAAPAPEAPPVVAAPAEAGSGS